MRLFSLPVAAAAILLGLARLVTRLCLPGFRELFEGMSLQLPLPTQMLLTGGPWLE